MWGSKGESWRKVQDVYSVFLPLQRLTAQKLCRRIHGLAACSKICQGASFTKRTIATGGYIEASCDGLYLKSTGFERIYPKGTGRGRADMLKLDIYRFLNRLRFIRGSAEKLAGFIKRLDNGDAEEERRNNNAGSVGKLIEKIPGIWDNRAYLKANLGEMTERRGPDISKRSWLKCPGAYVQAGVCRVPRWLWTRSKPGSPSRYSVRGV